MLRHLAAQHVAGHVAEYRSRLTQTILGRGAEVVFNLQPEPPGRIDLDALFRRRL
jgi:hypothetical protein